MDDGRRPERIVPVAQEPAGDDACWLGALCPECGAMPEGAGALDPTVPCWRCGAVRAEADHDAGGAADANGAADASGGAEASRRAPGGAAGR